MNILKIKTFVQHLTFNDQLKKNNIYSNNINKLDLLQLGKILFLKY